jgi:hypothetical protein
MKSLAELKVEVWEYNGYEQLVCMIKRNSKKLAPVLPSFLIEESIRVFSELDQYEKCVVLRDFANNYPQRIKQMSKTTYFTEDVKKV